MFLEISARRLGFGLGLLGTIAMLAACSSSGNYLPPDGTEPPVDINGDLALLDLVTGAVTDESSVSGAVKFHRLPASAVTVSSGDALSATGPVMSTVNTNIRATWIADRELTRGQWRALCRAAGRPETTPWTALPLTLQPTSNSDDLPAAGLSYTMINEVVTAYNALRRTDLAIPSGARWEAIARQGGGQFPWGDSRSATTVATYARVAESVTSTGPFLATGQSPTNGALAARDLAGNLWEWVSDGAVNGGPCLRGGSWSDPLISAQVGNRRDCPPSVAYPTAGVRLVLELP